VTSPLSDRTAQEVFDDHLRLARELKLEEDIERNVAEDCVVLTGRGIFRGRDGVRVLADMLMREIPSGEWSYRNTLVEGRMAFLEWTVDAGPFQVRDGADSFLIEEGKIQAQTIHYTVVDDQGRLVVRADGTTTELAD
jgi:hypothetical protein